MENIPGGEGKMSGDKGPTLNHEIPCLQGCPRDTIRGEIIVGMDLASDCVSYEIRHTCP